MIIIFAIIIFLFLENNVLEKFLLRMYNIMNYEIKFFRKIFITYIRYSTIMKSLYNFKKYFNSELPWSFSEGSEASWVAC